MEIHEAADGENGFPGRFISINEARVCSLHQRRRRRRRSSSQVRLSPELIFTKRRAGSSRQEDSEGEGEAMTFTFRSDAGSTAELLLHKWAGTAAKRTAAAAHMHQTLL